MGRELDFGSHVGDRPKKNMFRPFIHTIRPSSRNVCGGQLFVPKINLARRPNVNLGLSPSPWLKYPNITSPHPLEKAHVQDLEVFLKILKFLERVFLKI